MAMKKKGYRGGGKVGMKKKGYRGGGKVGMKKKGFRLGGLTVPKAKGKGTMAAAKKPAMTLAQVRAAAKKMGYTLKKS